MSKSIRKLIACTLAMLMLLGAAPLVASAADDSMTINQQTNRLLTTVNAFAKDPYTKDATNLFGDISGFTAKKTPSSLSDTEIYTSTTSNELVEQQENTRNIDFSISASATFYGITAKVGYELNYTNTKTSDYAKYTNEFFYNMQVRRGLNSWRVNAVTAENVDPLRAALTSTASDALLTGDIATLFSTYGTHVVLGYTAGGTFDVYARASTENTSLKLTETDDMKHTIPISVAGIGGVVDVSATTSIQDIVKVAQSWDTSEVITTSSSGARGGEGLSVDVLKQDANKVQSAISSWMSSLNEANSGIVPDENLYLLPIWDLLPVTESARRAAIIRAFYERSNEINDNFDKQNVYFNGEWPQQLGKPISNETELRAIAQKDSDAFYYLTKDIALTKTDSAAVLANFEGILDGQGHKITGLKVDTTNTYAGFVGSLMGTIKNLYIAGSVTGKTMVGGFAGELKGGRIENCIAEITVVGKCSDVKYPRVGGFVGEILAGTVKNCLNKGSVTVSGGIIAKNGLYKNDTALGLGIGGIVGGSTQKDGYKQTSYIIACGNTGAVSGDAMGWKQSSQGVASIDRTVKRGYAGGLIGMINSGKFEVSDSYNKGAVTGNAASGGIVGYTVNEKGLGGGSSSNTKVARCYNEGALSGKAIFGGGDFTIGAENNYFLNGKGAADTTYGTIRSTEQRLDIKNFTDFRNDVWNFYNTKGPDLVARPAGISIDTKLSKKSYAEYSTVGYGDVVLNVVYTNGSTAVKRGGFTVLSNFDSDSDNYREAIAVVWEDCVAELPVTVVPVKAESITLLSNAVVEGDVRDAIVVQVTMNNGSVYIPYAEELTVSGYAANGPALQNVTVSYGAASQKIQVNVNGAVVENEVEDFVPGTDSGNTGMDDEPTTPTPTPTPTPGGDDVKYIPGTSYEATFGNWLMYIFLFGFIWMKN